LPPAGEALPGSIRLDAAPGPERLFVAFSKRPLLASAVRDAALGHARDGARVERIGDQPVVTAWIVLPKRTH
jgi:hypothetical protein